MTLQKAGKMNTWLGTLHLWSGITGTVRISHTGVDRNIAMKQPKEGQSKMHTQTVGHFIIVFCIGYLKMLWVLSWYNDLVCREITYKTSRGSPALSYTNTSGLAVGTDEKEITQNCISLLTNISPIHLAALSPISISVQNVRRYSARFRNTL